MMMGESQGFRFADARVTTIQVGPDIMRMRLSRDQAHHMMCALAIAIEDASDVDITVRREDVDEQGFRVYYLTPPFDP
jgi:hypothetical protein